MRNGLFGRRRESIHPGQLSLFGEITAPAEEAEEVELYARERLKALIGDVELYALSAKETIEAREAGAPVPASVGRCLVP